MGFRALFLRPLIRGRTGPPECSPTPQSIRAGRRKTDRPGTARTDSRTGQPDRTVGRTCRKKICTNQPDRMSVKTAGQDSRTYQPDRPPEKTTDRSIGQDNRTYQPDRLSEKTAGQTAGQRSRAGTNGPKAFAEATPPFRPSVYAGAFRSAARPAPRGWRPASRPP